MRERERSRGSLLLLPLWEKVAPTKSASDEGFPDSERVAPLTGLEHVARVRSTLSDNVRGEEDNNSAYTAAVVTPPSMTMVWPVMKVDASEPR
jgi:hypothetical protein